MSRENKNLMLATKTGDNLLITCYKNLFYFK